MGENKTRSKRKRSRGTTRSGNRSNDGNDEDDSSDAIDITDVDNAESFLYSGGQVWGKALKALAGGIGLLWLSLVFVGGASVQLAIGLAAGFGCMGLGIYYLVLSGRAAHRKQVRDLEDELEETVAKLEDVEEAILEAEWEQAADQPPTGTGSATQSTGGDPELQTLVQEMQQQREVANELLETIPEQQQQLQQLAESMADNEEAVEDQIEQRIEELESVREQL